MSRTNPFPYGSSDGSEGCTGCKYLDQIFGMEIYPLCLEKGKDFACDLRKGTRFSCWKPEETEQEADDEVY